MYLSIGNDEFLCIFSSIHGGASTSGISQDSIPSGTADKSMHSYLIDDDVTKAEIYYVLNLVKNHCSYNSAQYSNDLFAKMFPDSEIAKKFTCSPTKCSYFACFGLGPYYEELLLNKLNEVPIYSVSFDESFNKITKKEQMDLTIRFWDADQQKIVNRYLGSKFLGHTTSNDLILAFNEGTALLKKEKIIQIGMDGPNSNLKFLKDLNFDRKENHEGLPTLINIGTCGLHVVHGAFRHGFTTTG